MLIAINLLLGLAALAGIAWDVATGQLGSMDGNFLIAVCMLLAAIFLGGFFSSVRNGELARALQRSREEGKGKATDQNV
jgi:hypothetical protein